MALNHELSRRHILQGISGIAAATGIVGQATGSQHRDTTVLNGNIPSNQSAWILLGEWDQSLATVIGTFHGWRTCGSTGSAGAISIVASSNEDACWRASATHTDAASEKQPVVGFERVEYSGTEYFAVKLAVNDNFNYDSGLHFSGTTHQAALQIVSGSAVSGIEELGATGRYDIINDLYAHNEATFEDGITVSGTSKFNDPVHIPSPDANNHAATKEYVDTFQDHWEQYDIVAEGGDPTGEEDVSTIVKSLDADRVMILFPPGRYRWDNEVNFEANQLVLIGLGDVWLVPSSKFPANTANRLTERMIGFGGTDGGDDLLIKNLNFDFTGSNIGTRAIRARVAGSGRIESVIIDGVADTDNGQKLISPEASAPDAILELYQVRIPDGSTSTLANTSNESTNIYIGAAHKGLLRLTDCLSFYGPNNGVRISGAETSSVIIDGGQYGNSDRCAIRHSSDGQVLLRNAHLIVDDHRSNFSNLRGVWHTGSGSFVIRNCQFTIGRIPEAGHGIRTTTGGQMHVNECYFDHEADERVFEIDRRDGTPERDYQVSFDGVYVFEQGDRPDYRINVDREDTFLRRFIYRNPSGSIGSTNTVIHVRNDNCIIEYPHITAPNARFGIRTAGGSGLEVRNGEFDVSTRDMRLEQPDVVLEGDYTLWDTEIPRLVQNGWGLNDGNPALTGDWEGNGFDGLMVLDTSTNTPYLHMLDNWIAL
jgi:hypothetical protein